MGPPVTYCNDRYRQIFLKDHTELDNFNNQHVYSPFLWGRAISPEDQPAFFAAVVQASCGRGPQSADISLVIKCLTNTGEEFTGLTRFRSFYSDIGISHAFTIITIPPHVNPANLPTASTIPLPTFTTEYLLDTSSNSRMMSNNRPDDRNRNGREGIRSSSSSTGHSGIFLSSSPSFRRHEVKDEDARAAAAATYASEGLDPRPSSSSYGRDGSGGGVLRGDDLDTSQHGITPFSGGPVQPYYQDLTIRPSFPTARQLPPHAPLLDRRVSHHHHHHVRGDNIHTTVEGHEDHREEDQCGLFGFQPRRKGYPDL